MTMTLSVLRCPDAVPPETRRLTRGEFSIGRGPDNDWTLADPDRFLSKRHCVLAYRSGGWRLADVSTNGTFHNRDPDALGQGALRDLRDGDRIRLGNYEIEVRIAEDAAAGWGVQSASGRRDAGAPAGAGFNDPFGADPFNPPPPASAVSPGFGADPMLGFGRSANASVTLPSDFDPLGADFDPLFTGPTQSDHSSVLEDRFRAPTPMPTQPGIPTDLDDWDLDLTPAASAMAPPPTRAFVPAPTPQVPAATVDPFDDIDPAATGATATAGPAAPVAVAPVAAMPLPVSPPVAFPALPVGDAVDPFAELGVPGVAFDPPSPRVAPPASDLLAAFLRGAGMADARPADSIAAMTALGAAFRALVGGLRQVLIARAAVKGEFRIEQTMIRARGNNPLKFSADDDDALLALIGAGRRSGMSSADAITEVLRDMRLHELATMAAMQAAVRALLDRFDPAPLRAEGEKSGGMLGAQKRARAFEAFEKLHAEISHALADDFDSVFGKAFARAYEQALHEVADKENT